MNEEKTPEELIDNAKESIKRKNKKLEYIKQRIDAAKSANNKQRLNIAKIDYDMCKLDIEKYKKKIEKQKIKIK